jgi:transposase
MPFTIRRWSSFGRPVRGRCGGSRGASLCHCRSVRSKRPIRARSARPAGPQPLRRHALVGRLKEYRRIATRYDKLAVSYLAFVQLAAIRMWL